MKSAFIFHNFYKPDLTNITDIADDIATILEDNAVQILSAPTLPGRSRAQAHASNCQILKKHTMDYIVLLCSNKMNESLSNCSPYAQEFNLVLANIKPGKTKVIPIILNGSAEESWPQELLAIFKQQNISPFHYQFDYYSDNKDICNFISSIMTPGGSTEYTKEEQVVSESQATLHTHPDNSLEKTLLPREQNLVNTSNPVKQQVAPSLFTTNHYLRPLSKNHQMKIQIFLIFLH